MPKALVALPVYNDAAYLEEAIISVLTQTFTEFTLLIVDDGSTDASPDIIQGFVQKDARVRCIRLQSNGGRPRARNVALAAAYTAHQEEDTEYLFWMDGDDICLPQRLEKQIAFMDSHEHISVQGTALQCFEGAHHSIKPALNHDILKAQSPWISPIISATACLRLKDIFYSGLTYNEELLRVEDYAFWLDVLFSTTLRISNTSQILYKYRYFQRPTNTKYHALASQKILQSLRLPLDTLSMQKHAMFANSDFTLLPDLLPLELILWANAVYGAVQERTDMHLKAFLRITAYKVERLLGHITDSKHRHALMHELLHLPLGKALYTS